MTSPKDLNLAIVGEDFTRKATDSAGRNFDGLQKKVDGFTTKKPSAEVEAFSRLMTSGAKDGESAYDHLQRTIDDTRKHVSDLRKEFAGTGSAGVFGDLKGAQKDLKFLESIVADMAQEGEKAGKALADGLTSGADAAAQDLPELFTPQGGIGAGVIAAVAVGLSPVLAAGIAGAITGGVGFGLIGAAALIQSKDPRIMNAFGDLKNDAISVFQTATAPLTHPFVEALGYADQLIKADGPQLKAIFSALAPAISPFVHDITGLVDDLLPGIEQIAGNFAADFSDPQIQAQIQGVEHAFGDLFQTIGDNPALIRDVFLAILVTVRSLIVGVNLLTDEAAGLDKVLHATGDATGLPQLLGKVKELLGRNSNAAVEAATANLKLAGAVETAGSAAGEHAIDFAALSGQINAVTADANTLAGQMTDKLLRSLIDVDEADNGFNKSLVTLGDTLVANGGHLSDHVKALKKSETGAQQNKDAILAVVEANLRVYDSQIAVGISAQDAAKKYDENTKALKDQLHAAGYLPKQIDALIGKYAKVPDQVNTTVAIDGLTKAINDLNDLERLIHGLPPLVPVKVQVSVSQSQIKKVQDQLSRFGSTFAADKPGFAAQMASTAGGFAAAATGGGGATEPARNVSVTSNVTATLLLNGRVFASATQRQIDRNNRRQKVGKR